jgi:hypothetical protein
MDFHSMDFHALCITSQRKHEPFLSSVRSAAVLPLSTWAVLLGRVVVGLPQASRSLVPAAAAVLASAEAAVSRAALSLAVAAGSARAVVPIPAGVPWAVVARASWVVFGRCSWGSLRVREGRAHRLAACVVCLRGDAGAAAGIVRRARAPRQGNYMSLSLSQDCR